MELGALFLGCWTPMGTPFFLINMFDRSFKVISNFGRLGLKTFFLWLLTEKVLEKLR